VYVKECGKQYEEEYVLDAVILWAKMENHIPTKFIYIWEMRGGVYRY
jgi:hypothetical protein